MKKLIIILFTGLFALSSCMTSENASTTERNDIMTISTAYIPAEMIAEYRKITPEKAYEMMNGDEEYILLDVRTQEEYEALRIEGALLIPDYEIADKSSELLPDTGAVILIYCRSGRRSAQAAKELVEMGYTNVYDFGGIIDWPYDTVSG